MGYVGTEQWKCIKKGILTLCMHLVEGGVADNTTPFLIVISKVNEAQNCAKIIEMLRLSGLVRMFIKVKYR